MEEGEVVVLLFYHYTELDDVETVRQWQVELCERLGIVGRVRLALEGINGTVAGGCAAIEEYEDEVQGRFEFRGVLFKRSRSKARPFSSLRVEIRPELVTLGVSPQLVPYQQAAEHISPADFHQELLQRGDTTVVLDIRNEYEAKIGRFTGAIMPTTRQFSDFPKQAKIWVESLALRHRRVLMYCTGGVRCERGSAFLRTLGVKNMAQLDGGIHAYLEAFRDGGLFSGKNFVFDERIALSPQDLSCDGVEVIGQCDLCDRPYDDYAPKRRCRRCRTLVLVCDECADHQAFFECHDCPALLPKAPKTRRKRLLRRLAHAEKVSPKTGSLSTAAREMTTAHQRG